MMVSDRTELVYVGISVYNLFSWGETEKGMVRSDMSKPALIFISLQEYTQQNTLSKF
jgi:hypothetical protein